MKAEARETVSLSIFDLDAEITRHRLQRRTLDGAEQQDLFYLGTPLCFLGLFTFKYEETHLIHLHCFVSAQSNSYTNHNRLILHGLVSCSPQAMPLLLNYSCNYSCSSAFPGSVQGELHNRAWVVASSQRYVLVLLLTTFHSKTLCSLFTGFDLRVSLCVMFMLQVWGG